MIGDRAFDMQSLNIDVIIPTYKPDTKLLELIDMLIRQRLPVRKLILVNTEAELMPAGVRERLKELDLDREHAFKDGVELIHIKKAEFDHAAARNLGISLSRADVFICMTDDAIPADEGLTAELMRGLSLKASGGEIVAEAYARQLPRRDSSRTEAITRDFNYPEKASLKTWADRERLGIKTCFASNVCCAYRRDIFDRLGGFKEPAIFNEDMVYASSVLEGGYAIAYVPEARVYHSHSYGPMQQLKRNFDLGMSQSQHREVFSAYSSESEGIKLVSSTAGKLVSEGAFAELPGLFINSAFKYAGYLLGKNYQRLPLSLVKAFSSNPVLAERIIRDEKGSKSSP